jgi:hypothetical protein
VQILFRVYWPCLRALHAARSGEYPSASKVKALGASGTKKFTRANRSSPQAARALICSVEK